MAYSNKKSCDGALGNVTSALGVALAGTPHQGELNGGIPAHITPRESPDRADSVVANTSGDSKSDSVRDRGSNCRTILQKWKTSDKGVIVRLGQQFTNRACEIIKYRVTHRESNSDDDGDDDGDGDRKLAGTHTGGGG
jgi:hypothetical protein